MSFTIIIHFILLGQLSDKRKEEQLFFFFHSTCNFEIKFYINVTLFYQNVRFYFLLSGYNIPSFSCQITLADRTKQSAPLLFYPAITARISGHFAPSVKDKSASLSGAPMPCDSKQAASAFIFIQLQRLEQSAVSLSPPRQKSPLRQEFQRPHVLNEPPLLLN